MLDGVVADRDATVVPRVADLDVGLAATADDGHGAVLVEGDEEYRRRCLGCEVVLRREIDEGDALVVVVIACTRSTGSAILEMQRGARHVRGLPVRVDLNTLDVDCVLRQRAHCASNVRADLYDQAGL